MRRLFWVILLLGGVAVFYGHPPANILISYDSKTRLLTAVISHNLTSSPVKDTTKHYIRDVQVSVNGKFAIQQNLFSQENLKSETVVYKIRAVSGDRISVTAACSIFGSRQDEMILP